MKKLILTALFLTAIATGATTTHAAYYPCDCGPIAPAVPVITYYGQPAVGYTPGHWYGAGPCCDDGCGCYNGLGYRRGPVYTSKVYVPGQPIRNTLKVLAP